MVFHWSLSGSKSFQVSRTLLSILANLNNIVVSRVSTLHLISKCFSSFTNPFLVHQLQLVLPLPSYSIVYFSSLTRSWYLSLFSHFFHFDSVVFRNGKVHYSAGFLFCLVSLLLVLLLFVNVDIEAAGECIPTKQRTKPRVPWETLAVRKKAC